MKQQNSITMAPWYRQFWPWFLIALPATAVVGGLITVWIAFQQDTGLVNDNYYRQGLDINNELQKQSAARTANINVRLQFLDEGEKVLLYLRSDTPLPEQLQLLLTALTDPAGDKVLNLQSKVPGLYQAALKNLPPGNYYLRLSPPDGSWIIKGKAQLPTNEAILLPTSQ